MKRLLCRLRRHPLTEGDVITTCPCGRLGLVRLDDPDAASILRIRAANEPDPVLAAVLVAAAEWIEEDA